MNTKKVVIIGSGINGLVAANYLSKEGFSVSIIEKNNHTGGACTFKSKTIENQTIDYAYGATVLGMMPDFIFNETGLSKSVKIFAPKHPKLVYFPDSKKSTKIYQDYKKLDKEIKNKWGEKGDLESFRMDEDKVVDFIREGCRKGETPSLEKASDFLGKTLTDLWIKGSAKNLLDHYFSSDKTKIYMGMTAIESGSSSIKNNGTAFTIPLMDSGSVFSGYWGYVKGGIWQISHEITEINKKIGINFHMSSNISSIDNNKMKISFEKENKNYEIDYDYLIFATDPITPSKILKNKGLQSEIEDNDFLGTSGKITAFFKNPVIWKESSPYKNSDSAFRFIFLKSDFK
ncbi:FAD-dependent oxidoreductase [Flavobacteriaceae bacterium]|nr:FAD-dependent oxidoreductase [Flavobacteriaceae bacterium]